MNIFSDKLNLHCRIGREMKMKKKTNKKGFTLIELLAVIVILGVIMLIAIPSINAVLTSARKSSFASTAKQYINAARNLTYSGDVQTYANPAYVTVVSVGAIELENNPDPMNAQSPFGSVWDVTSAYTRAYVVIHNDGDAANPVYGYYFIGSDRAGNCIGNLTAENDIDKDNVTNGCSITQITTTTETLPYVVGSNNSPSLQIPTGEGDETVSTVVLQ